MSSDGFPYADNVPGNFACEQIEGRDPISILDNENRMLRRALERARIVLGNMALENEGAIFRRWPISHEPLRADARHLLPIIDAALAEGASP